MSMPDSKALQEVDDRSAAVAKAPRITKASIESNISEILFCTGSAFVAACDGPDNLQEEYDHLTLCTIRVHNGFIVIGKSAPMSPANFNKELGQQLAYEDAFRQLWPLYAFAGLEDNFLYEAERPNPHSDGEAVK